MEIKWNGIKILVLGKEIGQVESWALKHEYPKIECLEDQLSLPMEDKYLTRHLNLIKNNDYISGTDTMEFGIQKDSSNKQLKFNFMSYFNFDPQNVWVMECGEEKIYAICTGDRK